jgi:hypothetical protein
VHPSAAWIADIRLAGGGAAWRGRVEVLSQVPSPKATRPCLWRPFVRCAVTTDSNDCLPDLPRAQGAWTPVCGDDGLGARAATLVCRQLQFYGGLAGLDPSDAYGDMASLNISTALQPYFGDYSIDTAKNTLFDAGSFHPATSCTLATVTCNPDPSGECWGADLPAGITLP